jgi:hypothetical protein
MRNHCSVPGMDTHGLDDLFPHGGNYHLGARLLPDLTDGAINAFPRSA